MIGRSQGSSTVRRHFSRISGHPCWGVTAEYGSWLGLNFGPPTLHVREGVSDSGQGGLQRRRVFVEGRYRLWIDLCDWTIFEDGRRRFHSAQPRAALRRAAAHLDGQILQHFSLELRPLRCSFGFDQGITLVTERCADARRDDELWHFYSPRTYLGLRSDARLEFGRLQPERLSRCRAPVLELAV